jgi:hypothetical protein
VYTFLSPSLVPIILNVEAIFSSEKLITSQQTTQKPKYTTILFSPTVIFFILQFVGISDFEYFSAAYLKAIQATSQCQRPSIQTNVSVCPNTYEQVEQGNGKRRHKTALLCEYVERK